MLVLKKLINECCIAIFLDSTSKIIATGGASTNKAIIQVSFQVIIL